MRVTRAEETKASHSTQNTHATAQKKSVVPPEFTDSREETTIQRQTQESIQNTPRSEQTIQLRSIISGSAAGGSEQVVQKQAANDTGLPDNLKAGIENLSGHSMDDVKVHHNSSRPAQLQAHAFAQGTDIHIAPGQQKHLPHEAWHVVQQKQGRVRPTVQMKGKVAINDDSGLEHEADVMGSRALQMQAAGAHTALMLASPGRTVQKKPESVVQRVAISGQEFEKYIGKSHFTMFKKGSVKNELKGAIDSYNATLHEIESIRNMDNIEELVDLFNTKSNSIEKIAGQAKNRNEGKSKKSHKEGYYDVLMADLLEERTGVGEALNAYLTDARKEENRPDPEDMKGDFIYAIALSMTTKSIGRESYANAREDMKDQNYKDQSQIRAQIAGHLRGHDTGEIEQKSGSRLGDLNDVVGAVTSVPATFIGNEGISGMADQLNGKNIETDTGGSAKVLGPKLGMNKDDARNMGIVGDSITGVTGLLGLAKAFKDAGDPDTKKSDIFLAVLSSAEGTSKTGESVSKLVSTFSKADSSQQQTSAKFGSAFEGYGAGFSSLKSGFDTMRGLVKIVKDFKEGDTREAAKEALRVAERALSTAKSVMLSIKAFTELVLGSIGGGFMSAIPGLDIAISAVKLIQHGYYLVQSWYYKHKISARLEQKKQANGAIEENAENFRLANAEKANREEVLRETQARLAAIRKKPEKKQNKKELARLEQRETDLTEAINDHEEPELTGGVTRDEVADYSLLKELRDANMKRIVRQAIHITTDMANIAGAIAILTGAGAAGGAVTKGAAAAVELALPAVRKAKQMARNKAARQEAKGQHSNWLLSKANTSKSTAAKTKWREEQIKTVYRKIADLADKDPVADKGEFKSVELYLGAIGVNEHKLYKKARKDPQKAFEMLVEAIAQREF